MVPGGQVLQGTFETLSLPEVLGLLASVRKSGALWLDAGPISGVAHLQDGHCHAAEAAEQGGPVEDGPELLTRLVDLCFAVMCQETGSFRFAADDPAPWSCGEPVELSDAMVEVDRLLKQWREILRVIPSLECRPQLLDALEVDELVIDRERWALLVAVDGRRTVRELVQRTNRPVIELCQSLLELVDAGAVGVIDPAAARVPRSRRRPRSRHRPRSRRRPRSRPRHRPRSCRLRPRSRRRPTSCRRRLSPRLPRRPTTRSCRALRRSRSPSCPSPTAEARRGEPEPQHQEAEPPRTEAPVRVPAGAEAPDKGAFLRLFSGLRDS